MKKLWLIMLLFVAACTNNVSEEKNAEAGKEKDSAAETTDTHATDSTHEKDNGTIALNNGAKWKADEATKTNVAALAQVVNDNTLAGPPKRLQLAAAAQARIDTLVKQCRMKGPDHDALHQWLQAVMHDVKELKEDGDEYDKAYAALKTDVQQFYDVFE
jgi:hypothetical protein